MGYSEEQIKDLEETIRNFESGAVVIATPTDLRRKFKIRQPTARVLYDFDVDLSPHVEAFMKKGILPRAKGSKC
jgi:predicted GTPase